MTRADLMFSLNYSIRYEQMMSLFFGRFDRAISFLLVLLGASAVGGLLNPKIIGVVVAVLSAWQFIYQPGAKSAGTVLQASAYQDLLAQAPDLSDADLESRFHLCGGKDTPELGILAHPAWITTAKTMALDVTKGRAPTRLETIAAFFVGYWPL